MEQGFSFLLTDQSLHSFHFGGNLHCVCVGSRKCVFATKLNGQSSPLSPNGQREPMLCLALPDEGSIQCLNSGENGGKKKA